MESTRLVADLYLLFVEALALPKVERILNIFSGRIVPQRLRTCAFQHVSCITTSLLSKGSAALALNAHEC